MASSSTSQLCWLGSSADPLRELPALYGGCVSGIPLDGVVCANLPSTLSGVAKSSAKPDEHLLISKRKGNKLMTIY